MHRILALGSTGSSEENRNITHKKKKKMDADEDVTREVKGSAGDVVS